MNLETSVHRLEARAASMTPKRAQDLYNYGTAAIWFGVIVVAVVAAWTLWEFWATLDTEFLLIGGSGCAGAAMSMIAGEFLRVVAAAVMMVKSKPMTLESGVGVGASQDSSASRAHR